MEKYGNGYDASRRLAFNSTQAESLRRAGGVHRIYPKP